MILRSDFFQNRSAQLKVHVLQKQNKQTEVTARKNIRTKPKSPGFLDGETMKLGFHCRTGVLQSSLEYCADKYLHQ